VSLRGETRENAARALGGAGRAVRTEKRVIRNSHGARNAEAATRKQKLALISEGWRWFDMFALAGLGSAGRFSSSLADPLKRGPFVKRMLFKR
jgi:hypothetical protein